MQPLDAERVREWRHRRMLSQQEVAHRAETSLFTIQRIERGEGNVRPKTGRGVATALGVSIEELLPKAQAPLFRELPEHQSPEERRIAIDYHACRTALERFCDHWQPALSGKRRLNRQGFQDFKADAASLSGLARVLMGAEMTTLGQQYDEEGDPVFYTERSEIGPAVMRFHDLAIRMDKIGKESFDEDLTSDPEMGQLFQLFPKAS